MVRRVDWDPWVYVYVDYEDGVIHMTVRTEDPMSRNAACYGKNEHWVQWGDITTGLVATCIRCWGSIAA